MGPEMMLELSDLGIRVHRGSDIVTGVDLAIGRGEILGLVGESGSGKTTTALALLGYYGEGVEQFSGALKIGGRQMVMDESMRRSRGSVISYVPQDPGRSLNPALRVADALDDVVRAHKANQRRAPAPGRQFEKVGLPATHEFGRRFPHQLSGGQQQRVCVACALSCDPAVIVLDEPTTGLDVVTQDMIIAELRRLRDQEQVSMVYVSHDLAVVAQLADRIAVMYAGRIVEQGPADVVLRSPRHPYTRGLLAAIPDHVQPRLLQPMPGIAVGVGNRPAGCAFAPRCPQRTDRCTADMPALEAIGGLHEVRCFHWKETHQSASPARFEERHSDQSQPAVLEVEHLCLAYRSRHGAVAVAEDVSFVVKRGSCLALVGESGSGKTTIARAIAGLHPPTSGRILLSGEEVAGPVRHRSIRQRQRVQLVWQNPADALNPRRTVGDAISRPVQLLRKMDRRERRLEVDRLLDCVRLPASVAARYPAELSGGERQRVAIARALAAQPDLILCDEITSALDVSVQAAILQLLKDLQKDLGLSLLFITHDLGVVASIADEVLVLDVGRLCEAGPAAVVLRTPEHPYTRRLLESAPSISAALASWELDSDSQRAEQ